MTTVVLIDDHRLFREGIRLLLEAQPDVEIVGEAGDGRSGVELVEQTRPDIVVIDIGMPGLNGVEAAQRMVERSPRTKVLALSMHKDRRYVLAMMQAGASGYLVKDAAADELVRAFHAVAKGKTYLSPEIAQAVVHGMTHPEEEAAPTAVASLTPREREVLQLLAEGLTSGEIASQMHISPATVDTHRRNIMRKTEMHHVADLTKLAIREGLTSLD